MRWQVGNYNRPRERASLAYIIMDTVLLPILDVNLGQVPLQSGKCSVFPRMKSLNRVVC